MNALEVLVAHGAREDVVIACLLIAGLSIVVVLGSAMAAEYRRCGTTAAALRSDTGAEPAGDSADAIGADFCTDADQRVPVSLGKGRVPPRAAPLPAGKRASAYQPGDFCSASLHAEHALAEARADLHRAVQRGICESEVAACRSAFRAALARYQAITTAEYHL